MALIPNWYGIDVEVAKSAGGVWALANPWENVVRTGIAPWPPPELIQKIYASRQARAFRDADFSTATGVTGFYSDLQSLHSEDAITWSVFGPIAYTAPQIRADFVRATLELIDVPCNPFDNANVWLWRRLPHPDTLVSGGPEVDFGIQTDTLFLLGEAKWLSKIARNQGKAKTKTQLVLRREFCEKYGRLLLPTCRRFVVLGVSPNGGLLTRADAGVDGVTIHARDITWDALVGIETHPLTQELRAYLAWKAGNTDWTGHRSGSPPRP